MILPDPRFELPALLYHGQKPTGNFKINWEHQLARGLVSAWLFGGDYESWVDLVSGSGGVTLSSIEPYGHTYKAESVINSGAPGKKINVPLPAISFTEFGLAIGFKKISGGVIWNILGTSWNGIYSDAENVVKVTRTSDFSGSVSPTSGNHPPQIYDVPVCAYSFSLNDLRGCVNDGAIAQDTVVNVPTGTFTNFEMNGDYTVTGNPGGAEFTHIYIYQRTLTNEELHELSTNPYQILIPA